MIAAASCFLDELSTFLRLHCEISRGMWGGAKGSVGAGHQFRGLSLSIVTCAIGDFAGGSSMPPQGLHSHGMPAPPQLHAFA